MEKGNRVKVAEERILKRLVTRRDAQECKASCHFVCSVYILGKCLEGLGVLF